MTADHNRVINEFGNSRAGQALTVCCQQPSARSGSRFIPLTQGQVALVDGEDYAELSKYKWHALKNRYGDFVAVRASPRKNGKQTFIYMHRQIMHVQKRQKIDHQNHNTLDNRRQHLRICTTTQNGQNRLIQIHSSRYKGVHCHKKSRKWHVQITFNNKYIHLGYFDNEIKAAKTYDQAARKYFGEFAYCNFKCSQAARNRPGPF